MQVKSANILLSASWEAKLCDFNLSSILRQHEAEPADGGAFNPTWMVSGEGDPRAASGFVGWLSTVPGNRVGLAQPCTSWQQQADTLHSCMAADSAPTIIATALTRHGPGCIQAPELLQGGHQSMASDVFSLGMVLYELLAWQLPWRGTPFQVGTPPPGRGAARASHQLICRACMSASASCLQAAQPSGLPLLPSTLVLWCPQIRRWVLDGRRPEVPRREAMPGPDSAQWKGLAAYCDLMR